MTIKEVIRTSGDVRRTLAQTISDIRSSDMSVDKGLAIAALSKEITSSLQAEVNVAKARVMLLKEGHNLGNLQQIGKLVIEEQDSTPTLSGTT